MVDETIDDFLTLHQNSRRWEAKYYMVSYVWLLLFRLGSGIACIPIETK